MTQPADSAAVDTSVRSSEKEGDLPLLTAVRELFAGLRAGAADVADLVAAEAHVALRLLIGMVLAAVGAAALAVFGLAGIVVALALQLMAQGIAASVAISAVALLCLAGCMLLLLHLRVLMRRVLFGSSRRHLRGND
jgi:hypothetical protein